MRVVMPRLDLDISKVKDQALVDVFERINDHSDQNPFSNLDGKIIVTRVKTVRSSDYVTIYHGLGYIPNVAFNMGVLVTDFVGTSFTAVYDNDVTNKNTLKVVVSDPIDSEIVMYVGRTADRRLV